MVRTHRTYFDVKVEADGDIHIAPVDATGNNVGNSNRRRTPQDYAVWEIHPVMKLEVVQ